jgi:hypothetical protein
MLDFLVPFFQKALRTYLQNLVALNVIFSGVFIVFYSFLLQTWMFFRHGCSGGSQSVNDFFQEEKCT